MIFGLELTNLGSRESNSRLSSQDSELQLATSLAVA